MTIDRWQACTLLAYEHPDDLQNHRPTAGFEPVGPWEPGVIVTGQDPRIASVAVLLRDWRRPLRRIQPDDRPVATRLTVTPETMARAVALGFEPGDGDVLEWALTALQDERDRAQQYHEALCRWGTWCHSTEGLGGHAFDSAVIPGVFRVAPPSIRHAGSRRGRTGLRAFLAGVRR
jgi:hypothetical protein